jgi:hypothetical protein
MSLSVVRLVGAAALVAALMTASVRANAPAGRYTAAAGVVLDNKTGLYWQQAVPTARYTYADALTYCSGNVAALAGTGWRLPAIKELQTLVDDSVAAPAPTIDASAFPSTPSSAFWSSTVNVKRPSIVWGIFFRGSSPSLEAVQGDSFGVGVTNGDTTSTNYVRCVR